MPARNASTAASPFWRPGPQDFEPADRYDLDLLLGDRSLDPSLRLAVAYVKFFQDFAGTPRSRLITDHPQIAAALSYFDEVGPDEAASRVHDLYSRHSDDVLKAIRNARRASRPGVAARRGPLRNAVVHVFQPECDRAAVGLRL